MTRQARIRQNPPGHAAGGGEFCHEHGQYQPPGEALESRRKATQPGLSAPRAWRLLERAERLRRTCPQCRGWIRGSTRAWRKVRAYVLDRDGRRCQLGLPGCTTIATRAHHTRDRALVGDNPAHLVAACAWCNQSTGEPGRHDPDPTPRTRR
jgi:5-methylcytosine-specific restriction endonuclease McrA